MKWTLIFTCCYLVLLASIGGLQETNDPEYRAIFYLIVAILSGVLGGVCVGTGRYWDKNG